MQTIKDFDIESLMDILRTFTYTTEVDGETVTVNVELFTHTQNPIATKLFLQAQGDRIADTILEEYGKETITAAQLADIIKVVCVQRWKHFLEMWKVNYNPIWNVDATETRVITTEYGKITTMAKNSKLTDEQKTDGKQNTTHGLKLIDEQKTDGKQNTTHGLKLIDEQKTDGKNDTTYGKVETITEPTTTGAVATFDSADFVNASQTSATQHSNTGSGTDQIAISMGKIEHTNSGTDEVAISMGKIEHTNSGTDEVAISMGKIEHSSSGSDTDTLSGSDTVTDALIRGGNIGVQMTQQLLTAEESFWSKYSFFEIWFNDIAEQIGLPIWG